MNISAVSFSGLNRNNGYERTRRTSYGQTSTAQSYDEFQSRKPVRPKTSVTVAKKKSVIPRPLLGFLTGVLFSGMVAGTVMSDNDAKLVSVPFDSNDTSIVELSEIYDVPVDILLDYNNISQYTDLSKVAEIKIPYTFDYIEKEIDELKDKLYSPFLKDDEVSGIHDRILALEAKKQEQEAVAKSYSDGKYVYFEINIDENAPEEIREKYEYGINVETFKDLFDIKDKAIRRYNPDLIDSHWEAYEEGRGGYYDYTGNWFHNGDEIKVPISAIQKGDIDLSDYSEE